VVRAHPTVPAVKLFELKASAPLLVTGRCPALANPWPFTHNSKKQRLRNSWKFSGSFLKFSLKFSWKFSWGIEATLGGFMFVIQSGNFQLGLALAAALAVSMWPAASHAYTPEQQQACSGDAFRLCSSDILDVDRVKVCMIRNKAQLSPECRRFFRNDPEPAATPVATGRPLSIKPAAGRKPVSSKSRKTKPKPAAT
jgi:hypothetical protein